MFFSKKIKIGNFTLRIPRDMAWCFANGEYYEKNVVYWVDRILSSCSSPVLYDIGANYGYFCVKFSNRCEEVYAFEPVSNTYSVLNSNISNNKLANVKLFNVGVSDKQSSLDINLYSSSGNNSLYKRELPPDHPLKAVGRESIQVVKLDDFVAENALRPPDIIKIDIEGAELYALQGARAVISDCRPFICMEYSDSTSNDAGYAKELLLQELHDYGYEIFGLLDDADSISLISENNFAEYKVANIIAVPKGKSLDLE